MNLLTLSLFLFGSQALGAADVEPTDIHVIFSNHFDAGCKISHCQILLPGDVDK